MPVSINGSNTPTAGGAVYGDGTAYATTAAGTAGQVLTSAGASAPTWSTLAVPGATARYSVVAVDTTGYSTVAFNPTDIASGKFTTQVYPTDNAGTNLTYAAPFWSTYYSKWFTILNGGIYASSDGLSWNSILSDLNTPTGGFGALTPAYTDSGQTLLAVDDSNGRFALARLASGSTTLYVYFSDTGASSSLATAWTQVTINTSNTFYAWHLRYCKLSTTSGFILVYSAGSGSTGTQYIATCPAGSTTFTTAYSYSSNPFVQIKAAIAYEENGNVGVFLGNPGRFSYNTSGVISSGWNNVAAPGDIDTSYIFPAVANGYYVVVKTNKIYYSANGSTWTTITLASNVKGVFYTGSNFIAYPTTTPYTADTFISSNNTPVSFSVYNTTTAPQRNLRIGGFSFGQRMTAT